MSRNGHEMRANVEQATPYLARGLLLLIAGLLFLWTLGDSGHHSGIRALAEALGMLFCVYFGTKELNRGLKIELGWPE